MTTAMLLMLLGSPPAPPAESPQAPGLPAAAMVIGEPPAVPARSSDTSPELLEHADGGVSIVFPEGYLMRTTLRRGFNGVWFTDCGTLPERAEPQR